MIPTRRKKTLFLLCTFLVVYGVCEALALGSYYISQKRAFSFHDVAVRRVEILKRLRSDSHQRTNWENEMTEFSLHPFLGYVHQPAPDITPDGFRAEQDPLIASRDPNTVIVGIGGGSVAEFFYMDSREELRAILQTLKPFQNKKIIFAMFSMVGYHQPQPLIALSYYFARGGRLDMFINLDGRNEAVDGIGKIRRGIYPAYPYYWEWGFLSNAAGTTQMPGYWKVPFIKQVRLTALNALAYAKFSVTASEIWLQLDRILEKKGSEIEAELRTRVVGGEQPYFLAGPNTMLRAPRQDIIDFETNLWAESSVQLQYFAKANHFYYFHFLQPSQYVPDSKKLTAEEKKVAWSLGPPAGDYGAIRLVYPFFRERIPALQQKGIEAYDLTQIYKDVHQTVYRDPCCHVNKVGNDLLAKAMGERIVTTLKKH